MNHRDTETQRRSTADPLSEAVIGAAVEIHRVLGPGLLESAYAKCLAHELSLRQIGFEREVPLPLTYKGINLECGYRLDFVVEGALVLEVKAVTAVLPVHEAQLLTYLRLTGIETGLLLNFHVPVLTRGIKRMKL
jgi:GxxExxY protein